MKKIFIVLTCTNTVLSHIIKLRTKCAYTHVSISLDKELTKLYSFGRLNPYNPFIGGFVHEGINVGTFNRFKNTTSKIMALDIKDENYEAIKEEILQFEKNKNIYDFNVLGLLFASFNKKIQPDKSFYCAEFVKYILSKGNINVSDLPDVIKPEDMNKISKTEVIYKGVLREYPKFLMKQRISYMI